MKPTRIVLLATAIILGSCGPKAPAPPPASPVARPAAKPVARPAPRPPLIPRKILFGNPVKIRPRISPDGTRLAYLAPVNGVLNVWVQTIGKNDAKPVTKDTYRGIRRHLWARDSRSILYLQDVGGNENFRLYRVDLSTTNAELLTPPKKVRAGIVDVNKRYPNQLLITMNKRDRRYFDVHRVNLRTGRVKLDTKNPGGVVGWVPDYKYKIRAALKIDKNGDTLLMVRRTTRSRWRVLRKWTPLEQGGPITFTKDGESIIATGNKGSDKKRIYKINITTGKITEMFTDPKADIMRVEINPDDHNVEAVGTEYFKLKWTVLDPRVKDDMAALTKLAGRAVFAVASRSDDDKRWIVAVTSDTRPVHYYFYDRTTRKASFLFDSRPELRKYQLAPVKPVIIPVRDGMKLVGYMTRPAAAKGTKLPMVLRVHGGPWWRDRWLFHGPVQWLANRGYVVLQVNFRGSAGFGKAYLNAGNKEWGRKMQHDLTDAVKWAIANADVDPKRVAILGGSYGGYATLAGVTFTPDLYAAAVDVVGPSNLITLLRTVPPYWKPLMAVFKVRLGDMAKDRRMLEERSPLNFVSRIKTPLIIFQGANDPRVKISESDQIVRAIRKRGGKVEYIVYTDEGHGFRRPPNRLDYHARAEVFLAKYLGGRTQPFAPVPGSKAQVRKSIPPATPKPVTRARPRGK